MKCRCYLRFGSAKTPGLPGGTVPASRGEAIPGKIQNLQSHGYFFLRTSTTSQTQHCPASTRRRRPTGCPQPVPTAVRAAGRHSACSEPEAARGSPTARAPRHPRRARQPPPWGDPPATRGRRLSEARDPGIPRTPRSPPPPREAAAEPRSRGLGSPSVRPALTSTPLPAALRGWSGRRRQWDGRAGTGLKRGSSRGGNAAGTTPRRRTGAHSPPAAAAAPSPAGGGGRVKWRRGAARLSGRLSAGRGAAAGAVRGEPAPLAARRGEPRRCPARPCPAGAAPPSHALPPAAGVWRLLWERGLREGRGHGSSPREGGAGILCGDRLRLSRHSGPAAGPGEGSAEPRPSTVLLTARCGLCGLRVNGHGLLSDHEEAGEPRCKSRRHSGGKLGLQTCPGCCVSTGPWLSPPPAPLPKLLLQSVESSRLVSPLLPGVVKAPVHAQAWMLEPDVSVGCEESSGQKGGCFPESTCSGEVGSPDDINGEDQHRLLTVPICNQSLCTCYG